MCSVVDSAWDTYVNHPARVPSHERRIHAAQMALMDRSKSGRGTRQARGGGASGANAGSRTTVCDAGRWEVGVTVGISDAAGVRVAGGPVSDAVAASGWQQQM